MIALLLAAALVPSAAPKKKTIAVGDNYYAPGKVVVAPVKQLLVPLPS